jgi:signal transduction histidine kinase
MSAPPNPSPGPGLVDHDDGLRHALLGYHQILIVVVLVVQFAANILLRQELNPRQLVFPSVMLLGLFAQNKLWRAGRDQAVAHVMVGFLVAATAVSLGVNGIRAPAVIVPVVSTLLAGYFLGRAAVWGYGAVNLALVWSAYGADRMGWTFQEPPPEQIWFGILVVMLLLASISLLILLRGLRSAAMLQDRERESLVAASEALRRRQAQLEVEIGQRTMDLAQANSELQDFSHAVSHDLQAPLRSVRGFAGLLTESVHDESRRALLERISRHADAMESLFERTLARSRARASD